MRKKDSSTLVFATSSILRADGKIRASKLVQQVDKSTARADKILTAYAKSNNGLESLGPAESVALITQTKSTKEQYEVLCGWSKRKGLPKIYLKN